MKHSSQIITISLFFVFIVIGNSGYAENRPAEIQVLDTGWNLSSTTADDWKLTGGEGILRIEAGRLSVMVPPNKTASWVLTTEPIWVYRYSHAILHYRCEQIANDEATPLLAFRSGSTGPVTPGALNIENPLARAGDASFRLPADRQSDTAVHESIISVSPPIQTEQIDQIVLTVKTGEKEGRLEIHELTFFDPAVKTNQLDLDRCNIAPATGTDDHFSFIPLHESLVEPKTIQCEGLTDSTTVMCGGIPFQVDESGTIACTGMMERDSITVQIGQACSEVYLLLAGDYVGTDTAFSFKPRTTITQPERLMVTKYYADGSVERSFPNNLNARAYSVTNQLCAYAIPVDAHRTLEKLVVEEWMSYGRMFLAAATLRRNAEAKSLVPESDLPFSLPYPQVREGGSEPKLNADDLNRFTMVNDEYAITLDCSNGPAIVSLFHKSIGRELLQQPSPLFTLQDDRTTGVALSFQFEGYQKTENSLELIFKCSDTKVPLAATLKLTFDSSSSCALTLSVANQAQEAIPLRLNFPDLKHIQVGEDITRDCYFYPRHRLVWGRQPIDIGSEYSGEFPLQFMDVYSESHSGGLAVHTRDTAVTVKRYTLTKTDTESQLGVEYGYSEPILLNPGERFQPPVTVLEFHAGDWHVPFQSYKTWTSAWYHPSERTRDLWKNVFICRRDYPIGGTGYLFDLTANAYTFPRLIQESQEDLGGIDAIDISGWAYSETYGRVGQYRRYELGGRDGLFRGVEESHRLGVPVGLYFEGYLIDPRSDVGRERAKTWRLISPDGTPKLWTGNSEMFMCPYVKEWQEFMAQTLAAVAEETGVDAVYMDQYGFGGANKSCFSTEHGHPAGAHPIPGEYAMLQGIREKLNQLDRPVALYMEQVPNDVTSQFGDIAFGNGMAERSRYEGPTKMNLFRYAFPSFKIVELFHPGIDPKGISAEDVKLSFFHGHALWLKGRARSWYSRECREFIRHASQFYHTHQAAMTSMDIEPLIPTLQRGLYANRFSSAQEDVIVLYNDRYHSISGELIRFDRPAYSVQEVWGIERVSTERESDRWLVQGRIDPHGLAWIVFQRTQSDEP